MLLDRGHAVHVVTRWNALFPFTLGGLDMATLYGRTMSKGMTYQVNQWASAIEGTTIKVFNLYTGEAEPDVTADTIVTTGAKPNDALYLQLKEHFDAVHRVGDCVAVRKLDHAIYEGYLAGCELFDPRERYIYEGELERETADLSHGH